MSDVGHWDRVKTTFERAMQLEAGQRKSFLDSECGDNDAIRREVEALISASDAPSGYLEPPTPHAAAELALQASHLNLIGHRCGAYRIESLIAAGGMGTVYRGVRDDGQFDQVVAIKVIRGVGHVPEQLALFRRELQTLARLEHPNIARLIDGGVLSTGIAYLILEYVDGSPISRYSDEHRLDILARIGLIVQACKAVQYAHQNLIVHRDLKPNNILVDQNGEVKLLDFGIAKLLSEDATAQNDQTRTLRLMTPQYASPEQIRGESATTASDVYSLGVIAYELMTGRLPHRFLKGQEHEIARIICEDEPQAPSASVLRIGEDKAIGRENMSSQEIAQLRGVTSNILRTQLRGDLDSILMASLHKDRSQRYGSVDKFQEDLTRWIQGLPIRARGSNRRYRFAKLIKRHKVISLALALALASICFGTSSTLWALQKTRLAMREAQRQGELAAQEARKATKINELLSRIIASTDPYEKGEETTLREFLDHSAKEMLSALKDDPQVYASVAETIAISYLHLGLYPQAEQQLLTALDAIQGSSETTSQELLPLLLNDLGMTSKWQDKFSEAESYYLKSRAATQSLDGDHQILLATISHNIGELYRIMGRMPEARTELTSALSARERLLGRDHPDTLSTMNTKAQLATAMGELAAAERMHRKVLEGRRTLSPGGKLDLAHSLNNLANVLEKLGKYPEALELNQGAGDLYERFLGAEHHFVANSLNNQGVCLRRLGRLEESEQCFRRALDILRENLAADDSRLPAPIANLASLLHARGDHDGAERLYREALDIQVKKFGENHVDSMRIVNSLALVVWTKGDRDAAEALFRRRLVRSEENRDDLQIASDLINLGTLLEENGNFEEAEELTAKGLALHKQKLAPDHIDLAGSMIVHGLVVMRMGNPDRAYGEIVEGLAIHQKKLPGQHWLIGKGKSILGECLTELKRYDEADQNLNDAYEILKKSKGENDEATVEALIRLSALYDAWGKPDRAAEFKSLIPAQNSP